MREKGETTVFSEPDFQLSNIKWKMIFPPSTFISAMGRKGGVF